MMSTLLLKTIVQSIAAVRSLHTCQDILISSNINCHIPEFLVESQVGSSEIIIPMTCNDLLEAFTGEQFEKTNGYSNEYWGWGGEDDDLFMRTYGNPSKRVFRPNKSVYRFRMIHHTKEKSNQPNPKRFLILKSWKYHWKNDGLSVSFPNLCVFRSITQGVSPNGVCESGRSKWQQLEALKFTVFSKNRFEKPSKIHEPFT